MKNFPPKKFVDLKKKVAECFLYFSNVQNLFYQKSGMKYNFFEHIFKLLLEVPPKSYKVPPKSPKSHQSPQVPPKSPSPTKSHFRHQVPPLSIQVPHLSVQVPLQTPSPTKVPKSHQSHQVPLLSIQVPPSQKVKKFF